MPNESQTTVLDLDRDQLCRAFLRFIQAENDCHLTDRDGTACAMHQCGCWLEMLGYYEDAA